ncbi:uncharacterized protein N7458_000907 [Penicillium daleae]|uniref:Copper acquisition factor BIM1-like domain-containing protein n=1 Tax=Penicillium daleae TaxID=63821 RepID=A0AAD6G9B3_9EURO|nr:uncharacterized protein N7458_000907 [Penicillium daleae]KAJ5465221.1 hypothetical protein N7458_000907 [Penicillium daleae]
MAQFSMNALLGLLALAVSQSSAHFLLNYPSTIGFGDTLELTPPCGGFTVDFIKDNVTDFHVDGDTIAVTSIHPQSIWLFRSTLDLNVTTANWTDLLPAVEQTGIGDYCEPAVTVPGSWIGKKGVISVVQVSPTETLYQDFNDGRTNTVCRRQLRFGIPFTTQCMQECNGTFGKLHCRSHAVRASDGDGVDSGLDELECDHYWWFFGICFRYLPDRSRVNRLCVRRNQLSDGVGSSGSTLSW